MPNFLRHRRLRKSKAIRSLVKENTLTVNDFIVPLFIVEGENLREEIASMPGYYRYSLDQLAKELDELWELGLRSVLLFCKVPDSKKDNAGKEALNDKGLMQESIRFIKDQYPEMLVFTDVALDPYSIYGHDGIVEQDQILNDETVKVLAQMAVSHAAAGADFVAPSDMMDGRVAGIRESLDQSGYKDVGIMSYTAKYASAFYGPFRDALDSSPGFGDKKSYQMDYANGNEAMLEMESDIAEGADIFMVKPGMPYLDVVKQLSQYKRVLAVYQVSGEYAMIKAASSAGYLDYKTCVTESLIAFKRAGANLIASYFAKEWAEWQKES